MTDHQHWPRPARRHVCVVLSRVEQSDYPCEQCGSLRQRISERWSLSGPIQRPASLGPETPHVTIRCADCGALIEEFDA